MATSLLSIIMTFSPNFGCFELFEAYRDKRHVKLPKKCEKIDFPAKNLSFFANFEPQINSRIYTAIRITRVFN